ncbi:hypothetical protein TNCV_1039571 [Trichonephila clavipes]|nr:hypothetical protein TNCV_1039571 [Trichonephila clavipes]
MIYNSPSTKGAFKLVDRAIAFKLRDQVFLPLPVSGKIHLKSAQSSSRCNMEVERNRCQLMCCPRHLTIIQIVRYNANCPELILEKEEKREKREEDDHGNRVVRVSNWWPVSSLSSRGFGSWFL